MISTIKSSLSLLGSLYHDDEDSSHGPVPDHHDDDSSQDHDPPSKPFSVPALGKWQIINPKELSYIIKQFVLEDICTEVK